MFCTVKCIAVSKDEADVMFEFLYVSICPSFQFLLTVHVFYIVICQRTNVTRFFITYCAKVHRILDDERVARHVQRHGIDWFQKGSSSPMNHKLVTNAAHLLVKCCDRIRAFLRLW